MTAASAVYFLRGEEPSLLRDAVNDLVTELLGADDPALALADLAGEDDTVTAIVDAANTPPMFTERRVVVGRALQRFSADQLQPLVGYLADPSPTTSLVLVWEKGRVPQALLAGVKQAGGMQVDTAPGKGWLEEQLGSASVHLDKEAKALLASHLGEDVARLRGVLESLTAAYGEGARIDSAAVEPYLGEAGGRAPWELTDAIDAGDITTAIDRLRRVMTEERVAVMVIGTLAAHVGRLLRLDGADLTGEPDAASALGIHPFRAKKLAQQARRLGSEGIAQAVGLVAEADLDLRGAKGWPAELVLELLVARLAFLSRSAR